MQSMEPWLWALLIKPFALLLLFGFVCLPIKILVQSRMKDGKLKRLLLKRIS
jgi:hypothetical protein